MSSDMFTTRTGKDCMQKDEPQDRTSRPPPPGASAPRTVPRRHTSPRPSRRRSALGRRDLTKGSVRNHVWYLGWPQVAEGFLGVVDQVADLVWAGRLGFHAIAGLGASQAYLSTIMMARMGLDSSMRAMIARAVGARRTAYANHVLAQSFTLTSVLALVMIAAGIFLAEPLLRIIGMSDAAVEQGTGYMQVQLVAMACLSYHRLFGGALQASGDSITPLKAALVSRVLHIVLSPILIFGWLGLPAMGLTGAALARLIAEVFGGGMTYWALRSGRASVSLRFRDFRVDFPLIWSLLRQGAPASVTNMQRGVSQLVVVGVAAQFGDVALAAFALARRAENIVNQSSRGMGRAAGALAGQNLGAGIVPRARSAVRWGMIIGLCLAAPFLVLLIAFPEPVSAFFNSDAEFISIASTWLVIATIGYIFMCPVQIFTQAFNTSGSTFAPMVITVVTMWAFEIPLTFILANFSPLGHLGIPAAIVGGMALRLVAFTWYYFRGNWLRTGLT